MISTKSNLSARSVEIADQLTLNEIPWPFREFFVGPVGMRAWRRFINFEKTYGVGSFIFTTHGNIDDDLQLLVNHGIMEIEKDEERTTCKITDEGHLFLETCNKLMGKKPTEHKGGD